MAEIMIGGRRIIVPDGKIAYERPEVFRASLNVAPCGASAGVNAAARQGADKRAVPGKKVARRGPNGPQRDVFTETCRKELGIEVMKEFRFHPTRKWRFDYAVPSRKVALEVEGGAWTGGRHTRAQGFIADMEKYNTATVFGWRVLRVTPDRLLSADTLAMIRAACS